MFLLKLVYQKSDWYYQYNATINSIDKDYKVQYTGSKEWLQYDRLYDENRFCTYMKQVDYDKFRPKVESASYDSYSIQYYSSMVGNFQKNQNYDIYIVDHSKTEKFIEENKTLEGFALFVYGNKMFYYKDHTSEESQSNNVYIFLE